MNLGYDLSWIELVPQTVINRFAGVGNPVSIHTPKLGDRILDAGCGCGFGTFTAAFSNGNVKFREGSIEQLPFEDGCFDLVLSNGVLNLVPDKPRAFKESARVLRTDGASVAADLLGMETIPSEVLASTDAWPT